MTTTTTNTTPPRPNLLPRPRSRYLRPHRRQGPCRRRRLRHPAPYRARAFRAPVPRQHARDEYRSLFVGLGFAEVAWECEGFPLLLNFFYRSPFRTRQSSKVNCSCRRIGKTRSLDTADRATTVLKKKSFHCVDLYNPNASLTQTSLNLLLQYLTQSPSPKDKILPHPTSHPTRIHSRTLQILLGLQTTIKKRVLVRLGNNSSKSQV